MGWLLFIILIIFATVFMVNGYEKRENRSKPKKSYDDPTSPDYDSSHTKFSEEGVDLRGFGNPEKDRNLEDNMDEIKEELGV